MSQNGFTGKPEVDVVLVDIYRELNKINDKLKKKANLEDIEVHSKDHKEIAHITKIEDITENDYLFANTREGEIVRTQAIRIKNMSKKVIQVVPKCELTPSELNGKVIQTVPRCELV